jgi:hypothetical protein
MIAWSIADARDLVDHIMSLQQAKSSIATGRRYICLNLLSWLYTANLIEVGSDFGVFSSFFLFMCTRDVLSWPYTSTLMD